MNEEIYRKKSLNRIKSPENLDDYIHVLKPGVWLLLVSVIVLLLGACVWGIFGHVDSIVEANVSVEGGKMVCYVNDKDISLVKVGMTIEFEEYSAAITAITQNEDALCPCTLSSEQNIPDGIYDGKIITSSVSPMSFVIN